MQLARANINAMIEKLKNGLDQMKIELSELRPKRNNLVARSRRTQGSSRGGPARTPQDQPLS